MIHGQKLIVVMPAYNAERTLAQTYGELHHEYVDEIILTDDGSHDRTVQIARDLGITTLIHQTNRGYGANQKTCYAEALARGADIVVMLHPDYQYSPRLVTAMAFMIRSSHYDLVLGSRILGGEALKGGMPLYKYVANRLLTLLQNMFLGLKLSEYHTGLRAFSRRFLLTLPLRENSDGFVFDNEVIVQARHFGFKVGEITCPARYFPEASSIHLRESLLYGAGVVATTMKFIVQSQGLRRYGIFEENGKRLCGDTAHDPAV